MDFTGVYHKTSEQMSYPKNERELIINLKTGYDVKRCFSTMEIRLNQESSAERKREPGSGRKSVIRSV